MGVVHPLYINSRKKMNGSQSEKEMLGKRRRESSEDYDRKKRTKRAPKGRIINRPGYMRKPRTVVLQSIPDRLLMTFKYNDRFKLSETLGGDLGKHVFRANSLFDPDLTGTGHQPLYYDQIVNSLEGNGLYHKYLVNALSYVIRFNNAGSEELAVCVVPTTHSNPINDGDNFDAICEAPYAQRCLLTAHNGSKATATIKGSFMIKAVEGVSSLDRSNYEAINSANPVFSPLLNICAIPMNESSTFDDLWVDVTLFFKAECYDRIYRSTVN